jgi:hypothetical protein
MFASESAINDFALNFLVGSIIFGVDTKDLKIKRGRQESRKAQT